MTDKPYAWINAADEYKIIFDENFPTAYPNAWIPLYTHPVKELPNNHQYIAQLEMTVRNQQAEIEALKAKYEPQPLTKEQEQAVLAVWKQIQPHLFKEDK